MRFIILILTLFTAILVFAIKPEVTTISNTEIQIRGDITAAGSPTIFVAAGENATFQVTSGNRNFSAGEDYITTTPMHIGPVAVRGVQLTPAGKERVIPSESISISWDQPAFVGRTVPRALLPVLRSVVSNWDAVSANYDIADNPGHYLIIIDDVFMAEDESHVDITDYINWKTRQGFTVTLAPLSETGNTTTAIKSYIQNYYESTNGQLAYVLLVGDADDSHPSTVTKLPGYFYTSPSSGEHNVTDHPYSIMDSDYFSDLMVGRLPVDGILELSTMLNKIIRYEQMPAEGDWLERALVVAGNYSNTPPNPITPKWISKWIRDKFLDYGYSQVDTVYYPPTQLGEQTIADHFNDGVGLVSYRGWADANGWQYPQFKISDINSLINNAPYTPIIASIVCNTGDFANNVDPVFGEQWMRLGTPANPKGAAGFFGPSDLHTSTKFNNSIAAGFYEGLLVENIHNFGAAAYRGKLQLYRGFPREQGDNEWVEFYFHVYNILGDPSTEIRTKVPEDPQASIPTQLYEGARHLELDLENSNIEDPSTIFASFISNQDTTGAYFDAQGKALLTFETLYPLSSPEVQISITGPNIRPQLDTLEVMMVSYNATVSNIQVDGTPKPGTTVNIRPTVTNLYINELELTVELMEGENFTIGNPSPISTGWISAGGSFTPDEGFEITIPPDYASKSPLNLHWELGGDTNIDHITPLQVPNTLWEVPEALNESGEPFLTAGDESALSFTLHNFSDVMSESGTVTVSSMHETVDISGNPVSFGSVAGGESTGPLSGVNVTVPASFTNGSTFSLIFSIEESDGRIFEARKLMTVGPVTDADPAGPDAYGYFAYDDGDNGYTPAPADEEWRTSTSGATLYELSDDQNIHVDLPWDFQFYGEIYTELTISSNGWVSFVPESIPWFRNWAIPAAIGAKAMIAGYWDDLDAPGDGAKMEIVTETAGDEFIITWDYSFANYDEETEERFQIVLQNTEPNFTPTGDDEILIIYDQVEDVDQNNNYSTVGIEAQDNRIGLQYVYSQYYTPGAAELQDGRAIRFTTRQPEGFVTNTAPETAVPQQFAVSQNYPNPFNPSTSFTVSVPAAGEVMVRIVNLKGQIVWQRAATYGQSGEYQFTWDGTSYGKPVGSGIYWYQVQYQNSTGQQSTQTQKMVLVR